MARAKAPTGETREGKFKRLANQRTNRILEDLRILGNLSNKSTYSYSEEATRKIFQAIDNQLKSTKLRFKGSDKKEFQL
jgi:hypothetical protein